MSCRSAIVAACFLLATTARADEPIQLPATAADAPKTEMPAILTDAPVAREAHETWRDNLSLFTGLEASRQPQDLGVNANFGAILSGNVGVPLWREAGIGLQAGSGVNLSHAGVRVLSVIEGTTSRVQWFNTVGLFKRADSWYGGVVYDCQYTDYYAMLFAGQVRAEVGVYLTDQDTTGLFGTLATNGANVNVLGTNYEIRPISQINLFWSHLWPLGTETRMWMGVAGQHGTDIIVLPDDKRTNPVINFGLQIFVPLTENLALFGQGNFVTPSDTGTLDAYLGIAYFFGGAAKSRTNRFAPVLPMANNATFSLDLRQP